MIWQILPHATACVASDRLFVLDLRQDRYFLVPRAAAAPFREWLERRHSCAPPPPVIDTLHRGRILRDGDPPATNALKENIPFPEPRELEPAMQEPANFLGVAATVARTWAAIRLFPLRTILARKTLRAPLPIPRDPGPIFGQARRFAQARNLTPIERNCLLDSLALDRWLARRGFGATLVFGIVAEPFEAHCWLQTRDILLNESFDQVSRFTPILAI